MSLAILYHYLCAQHVSEINISIIRSLRQPYQVSNTHRTKNNTTNVVIQQNSRKFLMMDILMSETCWAHKKWNRIASDIKLSLVLLGFWILYTILSTEQNCLCFFPRPQLSPLCALHINTTLPLSLFWASSFHSISFRVHFQILSSCTCLGLTSASHSVSDTHLLTQPKTSKFPKHNKNITKIICWHTRQNISYWNYGAVSAERGQGNTGTPPDYLHPEL